MPRKIFSQNLRTLSSQSGSGLVLILPCCRFCIVSHRFAPEELIPVAKRQSWWSIFANRLLVALIFHPTLFRNEPVPILKLEHPTDAPVINCEVLRIEHGQDGRRHRER